MGISPSGQIAELGIILLQQEEQGLINSLAAIYRLLCIIEVLLSAHTT